jgi:NAD(P)-dependent dehydrogenase (short-subunit alcohol dehydrogenase family)
MDRLLGRSHRIRTSWIVFTAKPPTAWDARRAAIVPVALHELAGPIRADATHIEQVVYKLDVLTLQILLGEFLHLGEPPAQLAELVNNAGNFQAGFFEELSTEQVRDQVETLLFGPMNVARAALPVLRRQRSGLLMTLSSTAGMTGFMFCSAYAAAKFGIEGWMESLAPELAPLGIRTMLVEPGFFRTELFSAESTTFAEPTIDDYAQRSRETIATWRGMDGRQGGDPAKLAAALVQLAALDEPPLRFAAGADAVQAFEAKARTLLEQAGAYRDLSSSLAHAVS